MIASTNADENCNLRGGWDIFSVCVDVQICQSHSSIRTQRFTNNKLEAIKLTSEATKITSFINHSTHGACLHIYLYLITDEV